MFYKDKDLLQILFAEQKRGRLLFNNGLGFAQI